MRTTRIISLLALLMGIGSGARADNQLQVRDVEVAQTGTATLAIETDFEKDDFIGYQFDVTLPKGLSLALDANNRIVSTSYTELDIEGKTYSSTETTTTYRLLASKMGNPRIPSGTYTLATVTLMSDGSLSVGEVCPCSMTNIKFSDSKQQRTEMADVSFSVTISDKVILDENSPSVPNATDDEVNILVRRTIKAGQWSTICLPFDMTDEQVREAFGDDVQLAEFDYHELKDDGAIEVAFFEAESIDANYPYIIKTAKDITEFEVTALIDPDEDNAVCEVTEGKGSKKRTVSTFTGTLHAGTVIPSENLFISGNKFYYSVGKTVSKAFRAYFWFEDILEDFEAAGSRISFTVGEGHTPTDIHETMNYELRNEKFVDLQGRAVVNPVGGLYIKNGRKVIIK